MSILPHHLAPCAQQVSTSGQRSAAVWKKGPACRGCAPLSVRCPCGAVGRSSWSVSPAMFWRPPPWPARLHRMSHWDRSVLHCCKRRCTQGQILRSLPARTDRMSAPPRSLLDAAPRHIGSLPIPEKPLPPFRCLGSDVDFLQVASGTCRSPVNPAGGVSAERRSRLQNDQIPRERKTAEYCREDSHEPTCDIHVERDEV
jgi:hypothetical protein